MVAGRHDRAAGAAGIRLAGPADVAVVRDIVRRAYEVYIPRMGKPPGPMLDDYETLVAEGSVSVLEADSRVVGLLVLLPQADHLLLDNVAVDPDCRGRGFGRRLIAHAEAEAARLGLAEVRLYTHVTMVENIALYGRLGFAETHRAEQSGYQRVFMRKRVAGAD